MRLLRVSKVEDALEIIWKSFRPLVAEEVDLDVAGGRYLAEDITAPDDVPAFHRSTVDGYAVRAAETFGAQESLPALLEKVGTVRMGEKAGVIKAGQCCYVPTGGMLPDGADAVVMIEQTTEVDGLAHIYKQVAPGENIIKRGEDIRRQQTVLHKGQKLRGPEIGLLGALGITGVKAVRRPVVGLISTGDEVAPVDTSVLAPGRIRDANGVALAYLLAQTGVQVVRGGIIPDRYEDLYLGVQSLLAEVDMVVLSGGSSVGSRDFTPRVLQELSGGELLLEGIAIQPGKPTILAKCGDKPILGLPGHPVSALNIFALFGCALIKRLSGAEDREWQPTVRARLTKNIPSRPGRADLVRVSLQRQEGKVLATPVFGRSGLLHTLAEADGVIRIDAERDGLSAGEEVEVYIWE